MYMPGHVDLHPRFVEGCFVCKLKTLQFGIVPGAYSQSSSDSYYDTEALKDGNFPTTEEIRDTQSDVRRILSDVDD